MPPCRFRYFLTEKGIERCENGEFYLQETWAKGYTISLFYFLYNGNNTPKTREEIRSALKIPSRTLNGILSYHVKSGFIGKVEI